MDPRNYAFGPWIETDRSLRVSTPPKRPNPSFYHNVEQRFWNGDFPEGILFFNVAPVGTSMSDVTSYHPWSDTYYGSAGNRLARQHASTLGQENAYELGPSTPSVPFQVTRTDADEETPHFLYRIGGRLYYFSGDWASGTPSDVLDFNDYGGATPTGGLTQIDLDGYGRVWVTQYTSDKSNEPWRVFQSLDFGKTWDVIFDARDHFESGLGNTHIHCVVYDPYDDMLIVCTGDGVASQTFISLTSGGGWYPLFEQGRSSNLQFTEAMTFPDHIALATDDYRFRGVMMVPKDMIRERVLRGKPLLLSEVTYQTLMNQIGAAVPFWTASNQSCQHKTGVRPRALTVVACGNGQRPYAPIHATLDGYYWREIARFVPAKTIFRMMGPDSNGIVMGRGNNHFLAFKEPTWS